MLYKRSQDLISYMRQRQATKAEEKKNRGCLTKCGSLVKTLLVWAAMASVGIPALIEMYHKFMGDGQSITEAEYDTVNMKDMEDKPSTPEDIARRA